MSIPRVPIYIFVILRHHVSMMYARFLWRTHCLTSNDFKAGVVQPGVFVLRLTTGWLGIYHEVHIFPQEVALNSCQRPEAALRRYSSNLVERKRICAEYKGEKPQIPFSLLTWNWQIEGRRHELLVSIENGFSRHYVNFVKSSKIAHADTALGWDNSK